jgi:uncharacterized membrane protein
VFLAGAILPLTRTGLGAFLIIPLSRKAKSLWIVVGWQAVIYVVSVAGIFPEIFRLLRIPWNSTGWQNVLGTTVGLIMLELPALVLIVWYSLTGRKKPEQ